MSKCCRLVAVPPNNNFRTSASGHLLHKEFEAINDAFSQKLPLVGNQKQIQNGADSPEANFKS